MEFDIQYDEVRELLRRHPESPFFLIKRHFRDKFKLVNKQSEKLADQLNQQMNLWLRQGRVATSFSTKYQGTVWSVIKRADIRTVQDA